MKKAEGMTNAQNIPETDTDFDDRARSEEERLRRKDEPRQVPPDKQPYIAPVNEPPTAENRTPVKENNDPPMVAMKAAMFERRIF